MKGKTIKSDLPGGTAMQDKYEECFSNIVHAVATLMFGGPVTCAQASLVEGWARNENIMLMLERLDDSRADNN